MIDLYQAYRNFCDEILYSEPLKKRAFKNSFLILLKRKGIPVVEYSSSAGIVIAGVGLKNYTLFSSEKEKEKCLMV